jgi:carbamoyltransferase
MLIIGGNVAFTSYGKTLPDGGLAALLDEKLDFALAEERLSRVKKEGGFKRALQFYLRSRNRSLSDVDLFVLSSCCDRLGAVPVPYDLPSGRVQFCSHHLSHALGSFVWSGFEEALVVVMDSGGDVFGDIVNGRWWQTPREQQSIYRINRESFKLLHRDADRANDMGFGEIFRAVTYYLGWPGARYAGNTMALSELGSASNLPNLRFVREERGVSRFPGGNDPNSPVENVKKLLTQCDLGHLPERKEHAPFLPHHFDVAAVLQRNLEEYLEKIVRRFVQDTRVPNVVLTGGVAYNCIAVGRLRESMPDVEFYVQPASGDVGQCFGNVCYGFFLDRQRLPRLASKRADLGSFSRLKKGGRIKGLVLKRDPRLKALSSAIAAGGVAVFHHGRSEYGPRALGFRSLIADATRPANKRRLNRLKGRNYLMPVAPVVPYDQVGRYFDVARSLPYMTEALRLKRAKQEQLLGVAHGSWCRIQTVSPADNRPLYDLAIRVGELTGDPILFNTSLNGPGEPITERAFEAFDFFLRSRVTLAWINGWLYEKVGVMSDTQMTIERSDYAESLPADDKFDTSTIRRRLQTVFPDLVPDPRQRFLLNKEFIEWVKQGRKCTTVRYAEGAVQYPLRRLLPLYASEQFEKFDFQMEQIGQVAVQGVCYKAFSDLDDNDARLDGFSSARELRSVLKEIYGHIGDGDIMTIFFIAFAGSGSR